MCREDSDSDTTRETYDNRVGDKPNHGTELQHAHQYQNNTRYDGSDGKPFDTEVLYNAINDHDKRSGRSADLYVAAP